MTGAGFPAHLPSKVIATVGSETRSIVVETGHDGTFTAELTIPQSWAGSATVTASADSGKVIARTTSRLR